MHKLFFVLATGLVLASGALGAMAADAPSLALLSDHVDLAELQGKVVYVDFWASWCTPCLKSFPWMAQMHVEHADDGLVILAINLDRDSTAADRFLDKHPVPFRVVRDPEGELAGAFDVQAMPTAFVFDREGKLAFRHEGFRDSESGETQEKVSALLGEGEATR